VEKFGEPTAAIVSMEDYRLLQAARERQAAGAMQEPVSGARTGEQGPEDSQPDARLQEARAGFYAQPQLSDFSVGLGLEPEQVEQLATVAQAQQRSVLEVVQAALAGWLAHETDIERARRLMRELGEGLGQGPPDQSVARDHDAYLYTRKLT
jgi:hypothetical protein